MNIFIHTLRGGVRKKLKNWLNRENQKKNNRKNRTVKKNRLKFWKNRPVRFRFYKSKTEKTEPNPNWKKPKKTEPNRKIEKTESNRFEPVFVLKNLTEPKPVGLNMFQFGFGFFKKNFILLFFL
jgi:hypothetical protein